MEPGNARSPGTPVNSNRSSSFTRIIQRLVKKDDSPKADTATTPENSPNEAGRYVRPHRRFDITEADLRNHMDMLKTALRDDFPLRHHSRYRKVHALLVCWSEIDPVANTGRPMTTTTTSTTSPPCTPLQPTFSMASSFSSAVPLRMSAGSESACATAASSPVRVSSRATTNPTRSPFGTMSSDYRYAGRSQGPFIPAAGQLEDVLQRRYGIPSQIWMIPAVDSPQKTLMGKVKKFVDDYGGADSLLIFWYGGRAEFVSTPAGEGEHGSGEVVWYGLRNELGVSARAATKILGRARADVLMINDSPFAQHAYMSHISGPGTFELIGSGSTTPSNLEPDPGRHEASLTRTLSLMLDSPFLATRGVSVIELHRKLLDTTRPASNIPDDYNDAAINIGEHSAAETNTETETESAAVRRLRAHKSMLLVGGGSHRHRSSFDNNNNNDRNSSSNNSFSTASTPGYNFPIYAQISQSGEDEGDGIRRSIVLSRLGMSLHTRPSRARMLTEPRVRFEFRLARPYLNVQTWKEWILRAPGDAEEVSAEVCSRAGAR